MFQITPELISQILGISIPAAIVLYFAWLWINSKLKEIKAKIEGLEKNSVTCDTCKLKHDNLDTNISDIKETTGKIWDWIIKQK